PGATAPRSPARSTSSPTSCASTSAPGSGGRCSSTWCTRTWRWFTSLASSQPVYPSRVRVFVVRHAEAAPGEPDHQPPLTTAGREAAQRRARELAGHRIDVVVSSPLLRARQTAEAIATATGAPVEVDERLGPGATAVGLRAAVGGRGETVVTV